MDGYRSVLLALALVLALHGCSVAATTQYNLPEPTIGTTGTPTLYTTNWALSTGPDVPSVGSIAMGTAVATQASWNPNTKYYSAAYFYADVTFPSPATVNMIEVNVDIWTNCTGLTTLFSPNVYITGNFSKGNWTSTTVPLAQLTNTAYIYPTWPELSNTSLQISVLARGPTSPAPPVCAIYLQNPRVTVYATLDPRYVSPPPPSGPFSTSAADPLWDGGLLWVTLLSALALVVCL